AAPRQMIGDQGGDVRLVVHDQDAVAHDGSPNIPLYSGMLATLMLLAALAGAPQDTAHVVLVATTDVHGRATAWDYVTGKPFPGGLVRAATIVDSLRRQSPGQVVVMDAGDLLQGDPFA